MTADAKSAREQEELTRAVERDVEPAARCRPPISGAPRTPAAWSCRGRRKWRKPPNRGSKRAFIGPQPQPKPASSQNIDHTIAFLNASPVNAHPPTEKKPG